MRPQFGSEQSLRPINSPPFCPTTPDSPAGQRSSEPSTCSRPNGHTVLATHDLYSAERTQPFCLGRKNFLFFGSDRGGRTLATLCSLTATCELRGVNPWVYLKDALTRLPITPSDQLATLLPNDAR
ncbi:MAG TPA: transposase domain-containing protein [Fimbriiglobus sp.]